MLQMHHVRMLRKQRQTINDNMTTRLHPGSLGTKGRRKDHRRVARSTERIGQQFYHRFCARKARDKKIGNQYSQIVT
jgi:hypothetical protein